jgi:UDP-N-acetylglucosamine 1-carboxyvinyltransferase
MAEEVIEISGARPLAGSIRVAGAKNAALPLMIASLLSSETVELSNIPNLYDVSVLCHLLENLGAKIDKNADTLTINTPKIVSSEAKYSLVKALRASFWVLAPLLARTGSAKVALPGGDIIGSRGVDIHLDGLAAFGAQIELSHGTVFARAPFGLKAAEINLKFPSVGATHQLLMAASLIEGRSVLRGVAREPEIVALADLLIKMGAEISGAGSDEITIIGKSSLTSAKQKVIGDRIEAGTYLLCALASQLTCTESKEIEILGFDPQHLDAVLRLLSNSGAMLEILADGVRLIPGSSISPINVKTEPFPGFPTDLQAPFCAFLGAIKGRSSIEETIYDGRFGHVPELRRMGLDIKIEDRKIIVDGGKTFSSADVEGMDIRGAAALVVAAICAQGKTQIHAPSHLRRGYEFIEKKLEAVGVDIKTTIADQDDFAFAGC